MYCHCLDAKEDRDKGGLDAFINNKIMDVFATLIE